MLGLRPKVKFEIKSEPEEVEVATELYLTKMPDGAIRLVAQAQGNPRLRTSILEITPSGEIELHSASTGCKERLGFRTHCRGAVRVSNGRWTTR